MDFRAPNFEGFVVPENNNETCSNVSSMVVRPIIGHEQQGPSGSNNFYLPNTIPLQQNYSTNNPLFRSNDLVYGNSSHQNQMFNLSSSFQPDAQLMHRMSPPDFTAYQPQPPYNRSIGYGGQSLNTNVDCGAIGSGPFTSTQLMELQNQTFIYKYISANVPVPPHLLTPLRNSLYPHVLPASAPGFYSSNPMRWGSPHDGYGGRSDDPEPGRCRRTDGKKWRCARDAIHNQKYCERHMNRGRHRPRRTLEAQRAATTTTTMGSGTCTILAPIRISSGAYATNPVNIQQQFRNSDPAVASSSSLDNRYIPSTTNIMDGRAQDPGVYVSMAEGSVLGAEEPPQREFGIFPSDSFVDPSQRSSFLNFNEDQNPLRHFIDDWPDHQSSRSFVNWPDLRSDWSQLTASDYNSMSFSSTLQDHPPLSPLTLPQEIDPVQMGLGVSSEFGELSQRRTNCPPFSHGTSNEGSGISSSSKNVVNEGRDGGPI